MDLLHSHDAYYCSDTLITGPEKTIQPHLFDDNLIKGFLYLFQMQLLHRKKAFGNQPFTLAKELVLCWTQALIGLNYRLLLLVKNFSFMTFIKASNLLKRSFLFIASWTVILVLYPILYPVLKLFNFLKKNTDSRSRPVVASAVKGLSIFNEEILQVFCATI